VRVLVPSAPRPDAILIPQKAVQEQQGLKTVYVVDADNKVSARQITATQRFGTDWVIDSGLQAGDIVVVDGLQKVSPGATVKPVFLADRDAAEKPRS
jgi:membrane fusion protein, multidrug efflux system